jgi:CRP-like cAMP-binding protein
MGAASTDVQTVEGRVELFNRAPQLGYFTLAEKEQLARSATVKQYVQGADVYVEGKPAESFAVIASGSVIKRGTVNRRPIGPPAVIGTLPLLRRNEKLRHRTAGLVTLAPTMVVEVPYRLLDRLMPDRKEAFLDTIAEEALTLIEKLDRSVHE